MFTLFLFDIKWQWHCNTTDGAMPKKAIYAHQYFYSLQNTFEICFNKVDFEKNALLDKKIYGKAGNIHMIFEEHLS